MKEYINYKGLHDYPTVISFFTKNWEYSIYAKKLTQDCEKLNLKYHIVERPSTGIWLQNTNMKVDYILHTIKKLKTPILWIDVDGSLLKLPKEFNLPIDYDFLARRKPSSHSRTWHVGTMFFNYNKNVIKFLEKWKQECDKHPNASDELILDQIWEETFEEYDIKHSDIPKEYFEMLKSIYNIPQAKTVIAHRASKDPDKMRMKREHALKEKSE